VTSRPSTLTAPIAPGGQYVTLPRRVAARMFLDNQPLFALMRTLGVQAVILGMNVATGVITARRLGPEGRGIYAAVTLWPPLLSTLAVAGLSSAVVVQIRKAPAAAGAIAGGAFALAALHSLLAVLVGLVLLPLVMKDYPASAVGFAMLCLVSVFVNSAQVIEKQSFAGAGAYRLCNLTHLGPQLLHLLALLLLAAFGAITPRSAVLALLLSGALAVVAMIPGLLRVVRPSLTQMRQQLRGLKSYWRRGVANDIVFAITSYSDRLILIPLLLPTELGLYSVAFNLSRLVQFAQPALASVLLSHMSGRSDTDSRLAYERTLRLLITFILPAGLFLWFAAHWLLVLVYGQAFGEADQVFRILVVEASLGAVSQVNIQLFQSRDRPGIVSIIQVIVLALTLAALIVWVPLWGVRGAALSLLVGAVARLGMQMLATRLLLKIPMPYLFLQSEDLHYVLRRLR
jgi:enterobacterial common antigen flippase